MVTVTEMRDPWIDALGQRITNTINNKNFSGHYDHTKNISFPPGKRGHEKFIDGKTGLAKFNIRKEGDGLNTKYIADITIPISAMYKRKTFIGVGYESREESWKVECNYNITYTMGMGVNQLSNDRLSGCNKPEDHDSVQWTKDQAMEDVITKLKEI